MLRTQKRWAAILTAAGILRAVAGLAADELPTVPDMWRFATDPEDVGRAQGWFKPDFDDSAWTPIKIGQGWEKAGFEYDGVAWYRVQLALPEVPEGKRLLLHFGAVDEQAWVWVNGEFAGEHAHGEGGWQDPFDIDITAQAKPGAANLVAVRVHDSTLQGGIWRPVSLALADPVDPGELAVPATWPDWALREGFNANYLAWGPDEANALKQLKAGCNVFVLKARFAGNAYPADRGDDRIRTVPGPHGLDPMRRWGEILRRHGGHLVPLLDISSNSERQFLAAKDYVPAVAMDGKEIHAPSVLDPVHWRFFLQQILAVVVTVPECEGVVLDTEVYTGPNAIYPWYGRNPLNVDYSDLCFAPFARAHQLNPDLPPGQRYPTLRDRKLLDAYQAHLRSEMRKVGRMLIDTVHAVRPGFFIGIMNGYGWFIDGLLEGLGSEACPTVFLSEGEYVSPLSESLPSVEARLARIREAGSRTLYCSGLMIAHWPPRQMAIEALQRMHAASGYWIFCGNNLYDRKWAGRKDVWALVPGYTPEDYWRELGTAARLRGEWPYSPRIPESTYVGRSPELFGDDLPEGATARDGAIHIRRTKPAPNLLQDPSIEKDWLPTGSHVWRNYYFPVRDSQITHSGQWAIRIDANRRYANLKQAFTVLPETRYVLTYWQKKQDLLGDVGHTVTWNTSKLRAAGTSDWEHLQTSMQMKPDQTESTVIFGLQASFGRIWYDDAAVRQVETIKIRSRTIERPQDSDWQFIGVVADIPVGAQLTLHVTGDADDEPLLHAVRIKDPISIDLTPLSLFDPERTRLRLILTADLGGAPDEAVVLRRIDVVVARR